MSQNAPKTDEHVVPYSIGIVYASVCADVGAEEVVRWMNANRPTGIRSQWVWSGEAFHDGSANPHPCEQNPARCHFLVNC